MSGLCGFIVAIDIMVGVASVIWLIIAEILKKNIKKPLISFITCIVVAVVFTIIGIFSWINENDYNNGNEVDTFEKNEQQEIQITDGKTETDIKSIDETADAQNTEEEEIEELSFTDALAKDAGSEIANAAYDILTNQIGFTELKYNGKLGETSNYEIIADGTNIVMTAMDDYYRVFVPNTDYVFYEDGTVLLSAQEFNDKKIDVYDRDAYYIMAKEIVTNNLKNPSSADFPSSVTHPEEIAMEKNGNIITVQSYVDAINSFNAKVREYWTVQFIVYDIQNYSYEPTYIKIGNDENGSLLDM